MRFSEAKSRQAGKLVAYKLTERDRLAWWTADGNRMLLPSEIDDQHLLNISMLIRVWIKGGLVSKHGMTKRQPASRLPGDIKTAARLLNG